MTLLDASARREELTAGEIGPFRYTLIVFVALSKVMPVKLGIA